MARSRVVEHRDRHPAAAEDGAAPAPAAGYDSAGESARPEEVVDEEEEKEEEDEEEEPPVATTKKVAAIVVNEATPNPTTTAAVTREERRRGAPAREHRGWRDTDALAVPHVDGGRARVGSI